MGDGVNSDMSNLRCNDNTIKYDYDPGLLYVYMVGDMKFMMSSSGCKSLTLQHESVAI